MCLQLEIHLGMKKRMKHKVGLWSRWSWLFPPLRPVRKLRRAQPDPWEAHTSSVFGGRKGVSRNTHSLGFKQQPKKRLGLVFPLSFKTNCVTFKSYEFLSLLPHHTCIYLERRRELLKKPKLRKFITGNGAYSTTWFREGFLQLYTGAKPNRGGFSPNSNQSVTRWPPERRI